MTEVLAGVLALAAGFFALVAAVGVLRFPDVLSRMHAASKVGTFAGSLALLAAAFGLAETGSVLQILATLVFLFVTAPIGAHLLGRAAAKRGAQRKAP